MNNLSPVKQALIAMREMQGKLDALQQASKEPIAIIGMACRFPGGANTPEAFWRLLIEGRDVITEVPHSRWDIDAYYDPEPRQPGKMSTRWGSFLTNIDSFDASFFGISPREAGRMDPQHRILLQTTWEALENAGQVPGNLRGSRTGTFIGITTNDYAQLLEQDVPSTIDAYYATGNALNAAAGRLAYCFGLLGPAMAVDTACSSSLTAIHLACQSLRLGECELALVGGINLILSSEGTIAASHGQMMAADGRCKTFDAAADGYVRGEGCGVLILKRYSQAQKDHDPLLALIRASAVNQNGYSSGFTVPNGLAQQELIREVLAKANVAPKDVDYVEAHGTGTALGDPIEIEALGSILSEGRAPEHPLIVGSVKTNIGHLEAASGMAGIMKTILALQHAEIPPHLHLQQVNPHISLKHFPIQFPIQPGSWPTTGKPPIAGVSSFGVSGTNAHILLEAAPATPVSHEKPSHSILILALSARHHEALRFLAQQYRQLLLTNLTVEIADLCYSAARHREQHALRLACVGHTREELIQQLEAFIQGNTTAGLITASTTSAREKAARRLVFVFPGQGSQWLGMGKYLYDTHPVFREALLQCETELRPYVDGWSLTEQLFADETSSLLKRIDVVQPLLFSIQVGLTALWRSWGIEPDAVIGHSMGEIAAAYVAGSLSLASAARIICQRSRLLMRIRGQGAMAVVDLPLDETSTLISNSSPSLEIAVSNSPRSTVIAGEPAVLKQAIDDLQRHGIFARSINVDVASHTQQVEPLCAELATLLTDITPTSATLPLYSTVTGHLLSGQEMNVEYWVRNVRQPVLFSQTIQNMIADDYTLFLEISPHPILIPAIEQTLDATGRQGLVFASLHRDKTSDSSLAEAFAKLYIQHYPVQWQRIYPVGNFISLPTYPWQGQRYWVDTKREQKQPSPRLGSGTHPFIGRRLASPLSDIQFETYYGAETQPFLDDHRIHWNERSPIVTPGSSHVSLLLSIVRQAFGPGLVILKDVQFMEPLVLHEPGEGHVLQVLLTPESTTKTTFKVFSALSDEKQKDAPWTLHATGHTHVTDPQLPDSQHALHLLSQMRTQYRSEFPAAEFYQEFWNIGYRLGPGFRWMQHIWRAEGEALCEMREAEPLDMLERYQLPPGLIDSCFQLLSLTLPEQNLGDLIHADKLYVPLFIEHVAYHGHISDALWAHARWTNSDATSKEIVRGDVQLFTRDGTLIAEITGLHIKRTDRQAFLQLVQPEIQDMFYEVAWLPQEHVPSTSPTQPGHWLIFIDETGYGQQLAKALEKKGDTCQLVRHAGTTCEETNQYLLIDPQDPEAYARVFAHAQHYTGIVHLWSLDVPFGQVQQDALFLNSGSVLYVVQALAQQGSQTMTEPRLWIVTRGSQHCGQTHISVSQSPVWGLGRTIAVEYPGFQCTCLDLDPADNRIDNLQAELYAGDKEQQLAFRGNIRYIARLLRYTPQSAPSHEERAIIDNQPIRLDITERGLLDNLVLRPLLRSAPGPKEVEIRVHATGLNFRDVLNALNLYPGDAGAFGGECSGVITAVGQNVTDFQVGDRVMAIFAPGGSFSSYITVSTSFVSLIPEQYSFEEAVTLPMTFLTAAYGLTTLAHLSAGDRVLIHAAAGGVGMAAVQIAQHCGAEIFATAGSEEKRAYLASLGIKYVMDSRSLTFADEVLHWTDGHGVDIVLNSLTDEFIPASLKALRNGGQFVEIGKKGIWTSEQFAQIRPDVYYIPFDLVKIAREEPSIITVLFANLMQAFKNGSYGPLPRKVFPLRTVVEAFRYMAHAKHIGKIVVTHTTENIPTAEDPTKPSLTIRTYATYLITGGLGGLGLVFARWLVEKGARHLVLVGRHAASSKTTRTIEELKHKGAHVHVYQADISQEDQVSQLFTWLHQHAPLGGVIHAAGLLDDGVIAQQTWQRFEHVYAPKVFGAWHLHTHTQSLPLDFFVLISSAASLIGTAGQGNYAAANAFLDALAHARHQQGLPSLSINWGAWNTVGLAQERGAESNLTLRGMDTISPEQGIQTLDLLLAEHTLIQAVIFPMRWSQYVAWLEEHNEQPPALFTDLIQQARRQQGRAAAPVVASQTLVKQLEQAPPHEKTHILFTHVLHQAKRVLALAPEQGIDPDRPLQEFGLDSLMAVELRNALRAAINQPLPATLLFDHPTLQALVHYLAHDVLHIATTATEHHEQHKPSHNKEILVEIEQLSDEDVDDMLDSLAQRLRKNEEI